MKKIILISLIIMMALMTGCGNESNNIQQTEGTTVEEATESVLSTDEIAEYNRKLESIIDNGDGSSTMSEISCFFTSYYEDPMDIDLPEFLRYCPLAEAVNDEDEFQKIKAAADFELPDSINDMNTPIWKYRREAVDALLTKYTGISTADLSGKTNGRSELVYVEDTDSWYNFTSDCGPGFFTAVSGVREGNVCTLKDERGCSLVFEDNNGDIKIRSHLGALTKELVKTGTISEIMAVIEADNIGDFSTMEYDRDYFASVMNDLNEYEITAEKAEEIGAVTEMSEELPNETPWWTSFSVVIGDDRVCDLRMFENDKTGVTCVKLTGGGREETAFYENENLYDVVRREGEKNLLVDEDAFEKYGAKAKEAAEASFESEKDELGLTDIKLVHFVKVLDGKDDEGNDLYLFIWEYSVGVKDPKNTLLAAGMRFDYELRLRSFNGYFGQLAVKEKDGKVVNTALIVNDEMVYVGDDMTKDDKAFAINRMLEKLG